MENQKVETTTSQCQQCFQPLSIQQAFPTETLRGWHHAVNEFAQAEGIDQGDDEGQANQLMEHDAIFFGGEPAADISSSTMLALRLKDFADLKTVQLKHPVCFECFEEVLKHLESKVNAHEQERDMFKAELQNIEKELLEAGRYDEDLVTELADLEEQERGLDKALAELEVQEKA